MSKKAAFQELLDAYHKLRELFSGNTDIQDDIKDEEVFFRDNFERFNFPFENKGSFTVGIEDHLADIWQNCIESLLGEPKITKNAFGTECDRFWKVSYHEIDITVHIYNNPKNKKGSKLMLQGRPQSLICSYVFDELPKIYKLVLQNSPKYVPIDVQGERTSHKPTVKCSECKFTSSLIQMKKHMKLVHGPRQNKSQKRISQFTPFLKTSKKQKYSPRINLFLNTDHDITLDATLDEAVLPEILTVESCTFCDFVCDTVADLQSHIKLVHSQESSPENNDVVRLSPSQQDDKVPCVEALKAIKSPIAEVNAVPPSPEAVDHEDGNPETKSSLVAIEEKVICGECSKAFASYAECEVHINTHTQSCDECDFTAQTMDIITQHTLEAHQTVNSKAQTDEIFPCDKHDLGLASVHDLQGHNIEYDTNEKQQKEYSHLSCDQCDFEASEVRDFITHILNVHKQYLCAYCEHRAESNENLSKHIAYYHTHEDYLSSMANTLEEINQKFAAFEMFKVELKDILNKIIDGHNATSQDLFVIRNGQALSSSKLLKLESSLVEISSKVVEKDPLITTYSSVASSSTPRVPLPSRPSIITQNTSNRSDKKPVTSFPQKAKILFVGDSIIDHANLDAIEKVSKCKVTKVKAYTASSNVANAHKFAPQQLQRNFLQVVPDEACKDSYEKLIVQTGAVDITNLEVVDNSDENLEFFKQETVKSARNVFDACLLALDRQPSLKKIVLMKQTPRYDPTTVDPFGLKAALSQIFNSTLTELWMSSTMKNKIYLGSHNMECSGAILLSRYQHTKSGKFDGLHLFGASGSKAYTRSVLNILQSSVSSDPSSSQGNL